MSRVEKIRSSLSKYTKQIQIANAAREFANVKVGHEPDRTSTSTIDIESKRSRRYALINAVGYEGIITFFDEYNGTRVKSSALTKFVRNCAHTQGKRAMRIFLMAIIKQKMILALKFNT
jgi:hypothetical protein